MQLHSQTPSVEDDGCCGSGLPIVPPDVAPIILLLGIFSPGIGQILAAYYDPSGCNCKCVTTGVLQLLTCFLIIGYIWSLADGIVIYKKSNAYWAANLPAATNLKKE